MPGTFQLKIFHSVQLTSCGTTQSRSPVGSEVWRCVLETGLGTGGLEASWAGFRGQPCTQTATFVSMQCRTARGGPRGPRGPRERGCLMQQLVGLETLGNVNSY